MSDLDDKLDYILKSNAAISLQDSMALTDYAKLIPEIRQAFQEAGYIDATKLLHVSQLLQEQAEQILKMSEVLQPSIYGTGLMTGQGWYERFKAELLRYFNTVSTLEREIWQVEQIPLPALRALEAAARAAGIRLPSPPPTDWPDIQQQHIDNSEQS